MVRTDEEGREDAVEISCKIQVSCSKKRPEQEGKRLECGRSIFELSNKDSSTNKPGKEGGVPSGIPYGGWVDMEYKLG